MVTSVAHDPAFSLNVQLPGSALEAPRPWVFTDDSLPAAVWNLAHWREANPTAPVIVTLRVIRGQSRRALTMPARIVASLLQENVGVPRYPPSTRIMDRATVMGRLEPALAWTRRQMTRLSANKEEWR